MGLAHHDGDSDVEPSCGSERGLVPPGRNGPADGRNAGSCTSARPLAQVSEHRIAFHRLGRRVRLSPVDIRAYINSARVEPMTEADTWRELRQVR